MTENLARNQWCCNFKSRNVFQSVCISYIHEPHQCPLLHFVWAFVSAKLPIHAKFAFGGGDWEGPRFPGEIKVSLAWDGDSNGHQASFQTEKEGTVKSGGGKGGRGAGSQESNENRPSILWRQWHKGSKKGFEVLEAFPVVSQPLWGEGCPRSKFQLQCRFMSVSLLFWAWWKYLFCWNSSKSPWRLLASCLQ